MSMTIQRATGFQDVLPEDRRYWDAITAAATAMARRYGFERVDTPIIEYTELFVRGVGTGSDFFVQKEMYTLTEPDGSSVTLRPEFTAGFVRAYLQNGMANWPQPVKLYTIGPSFRRERPQAGRFRQHSQLNCEILGELDPAADVEGLASIRNALIDRIYKMNRIKRARVNPVYFRNKLEDRIYKMNGMQPNPVNSVYLKNPRESARYPPSIRSMPHTWYAAYVVCRIRGMPHTWYANLHNYAKRWLHIRRTPQPAQRRGSS